MNWKTYYLMNFNTFGQFCPKVFKRVQQALESLLRGICSVGNISYRVNFKGLKTAFNCKGE